MPSWHPRKVSGPPTASPAGGPEPARFIVPGESPATAVQLNLSTARRASTTREDPERPAHASHTVSTARPGSMSYFCHGTCSPVAYRVPPSGLKARDRVPSPGVGRAGPRGCRETTSHSCTVPWFPATARVVPSGEKASTVASSGTPGVARERAPDSVPTGVCRAPSHKDTSPRYFAAPIRRASGLNANRQASHWPSSPGRSCRTQRRRHWRHARLHHLPADHRRTRTAPLVPTVRCRVTRPRRRAPGGLRDRAVHAASARACRKTWGLGPVEAPEEDLPRPQCV